MESLTHDVLVHLTEMLSPLDVANLSMCSKTIRQSMRELASPPLRLRISSIPFMSTSSPFGKTQEVLDHVFFVSETNGRIVRNGEILTFGTRYRLWKIDEQRSQVVNMVYHLPFEEETDVPRKIYDIALQPGQKKSKDPPRLFWWEIHGGKLGEPVPWNSPCQLHGSKYSTATTFNPPLVLAARYSTETSTTQFSWFALEQDKVNQTVETSKLVLEAVRPDVNQIEEESPKHFQFCSSLQIRAVRVFLFAPLVHIYDGRSLEYGEINVPSIPLRRAIVPFRLWTDTDHLYVLADKLDFSLLLPLVFHHEYDEVPYHDTLMEMMWNSHRFYTYACRYYFAVAADKGERESTTITAQKFARDCDAPITVRGDDAIHMEVPQNERSAMTWVPSYKPIPDDPDRRFYALMAH